MSSTTQPGGEAAISEDEYLRRQAEEAKAAVAKALLQAKQALAGSVDPSALTRKHPWLAIGSAVAAGFAAAAAAIPSKEQQRLRRAEKLRQAMHPDPPAAAAAGNGKTGEAKPPQPFAQVLLHEAIQLVKPVLIAAITASIKGSEPPSPPPVADGDK
jgi:hypothetical protein